MKLRSELARNRPASSVGLPFQNGANWSSSFVLRKATICSGMGMFTADLANKAPKTARICSKRIATSRPRFSPASVTRVKCGDLTSTHCTFPPNDGIVHSRNPAKNAARRAEGFDITPLPGAAIVQQTARVICVLNRGEGGRPRLPGGATRPSLHLIHELCKGKGQGSRRLR